MTIDYHKPRIGGGIIGQSEEFVRWVLWDIAKCIKSAGGSIVLLEYD